MLSLIVSIIRIIISKIRRPRGVSDLWGFVCFASQQLRFFASDPQSLQALLVGGCPPPDLGDLTFINVNRSSRELHFEVPRRPRSPKSELQSPLPSEVAFSAAFASLFRLFPTSLKCFPLEPARAGAMFDVSAFCARSYQKCFPKWLQNASKMLPKPLLTAPKTAKTTKKRYFWSYWEPRRIS